MKRASTPRRVRPAELPFYVSSADAPAKRQILMAALELFARDGLCETSVRDIAKVAGCTNPALFKHFSSKDELADYLFERCYLELSRIVDRGMRSSKSFRVRQRAIVEAYIDALTQDPNAVLYVQDGLRRFWPRMPAATRQHSIAGRVRTLLSDGRDEGMVTREVELELLTVVWLGSVQQFARAHYFGDIKGPTDKLAVDLEGLLSRVVHT